MGIGISILVFAVGAMFTFLVNATIAGIDIHVVGWLLMAAGAIGLIVEMAVLTRRRRRRPTGAVRTPLGHGN